MVLLNRDGTMKKNFKYIDKPLLFAIVLLTTIGLVMVYSASSVVSVLQYKVGPGYFFKKQLIVVIVSYIFSILFVLRFPTKNYHKFKSVMMILVLIALVGLFPYGTVTNSARSWYNLGLFSLQPSEFAKSIIIIYMGCYFGKNISSPKRFFFLRPIIACALTTLLIFLQPDLGTAAIIALIVFFMFMAIPFSKSDKDVKLFKIFGLIAISFVAIMMVFGGELLNSEQVTRLTYKEPCTRYNEKTGYQVCNGMIAINNGGLFGVGLGNSTQKYLYLPEAHTDFVFPIIVEELGSIVGAFIILLYLFIVFRLIKIARKSADLTSSLISYGMAIMLVLHIIINIGGVLALIPLTGVPLPLLSYGGSITINTIIMLFVALRISIETNKKNDKSSI